MQPQPSTIEFRGNRYQVDLKGQCLVPDHSSAQVLSFSAMRKVEKGKMLQFYFDTKHKKIYHPPRLQPGENRKFSQHIELIQVPSPLLIELASLPGNRQNPLQGLTGIEHYIDLFTIDLTTWNGHILPKIAIHGYPFFLDVIGGKFLSRSHPQTIFGIPPAAMSGGNVHLVFNIGTGTVVPLKDLTPSYIDKNQAVLVSANLPPLKKLDPLGVYVVNRVQADLEAAKRFRKSRPASRRRIKEHKGNGPHRSV